jgi:mannose/cellobiose epimerase-like protein (N-acyl-D-glucosamine 2-epimerase family)
VACGTDAIVAAARHPVLGGWYDQYDRDSRSLVDFIPASSFYHVLCANPEAERVLSPGPLQVFCSAITDLCSAKRR